MENQNQHAHGEQNAEKKNQPSAQGGGNRNRHRRRHHKNNRPKNENADNTSVRQETASEQAKESAAKRSVEKNGADQGQKKHQKSRNDRRKGGRRDNRGNRPTTPGLYDPYEEPSVDELSLQELRSRIVVRPAEDPLISSATAEAENEEPINVDHILDAQETPTEIPEEERVEIVGVRFRAAGKTYYFDPHGITAKKGDYAIVETARGPEFGDVYLGNTYIRKKDTVSPLRPLVRIATEADVAHHLENREKEKDALRICYEKILSHKLDMKLVDAQYAFDNSKLLFYFTSEGRVDFRDLVKDLASVFRTRIELRQIGIRDEAKMLGGLGACGRTLCCSTFLPDFAQVSIKMAKEQNLSLNSTKISGLCGRLMCCLRFESDVYTEEIRKTPPVDSVVKTEDGIGYVISTNPLAGTVRVILKDTPDVAPKQYHRNDVVVLEKDRRRANDKASAEKETD